MKSIKDLVENKIVPVITGPTAIGKTDVGIAIAKKINGEIISVDSRQIYKGLDIGTSKPTLRQQSEISHHLIDLLEIEEKISAGRCRELANEAIKGIFSRGKIPILVGGAGLYIKAIVKGLFKSSRTDQLIREEIRQELKKRGNIYLYNKLVDIDPDYALKIHINDAKRITRALELYKMTGKKPSELFKEGSVTLPYNFRIFILNTKRDYLYDRINKRVDLMIQEGLIDEVRSFLKQGKRSHLEYLLTLGYKEVIHYLDNKCTKEEMIENLKKNTRQYAKRQLTWFRHQLDGKWIDVKPGEEPVQVADRILKILIDAEN
ncbi:MAG: tRNA (adenosine(37)-N6)-dimethylallyltransferase MiaA [Candidatus Marinimicrobia bacterium]|nr:tRNA (adenosine(37)-N6)-dimethylallyltransferase MiaA [Candidatus Neomarinimicrobiota bacterium]